MHSEEKDIKDLRERLLNDRAAYSDEYWEQFAQKLDEDEPVAAGGGIRRRGWIWLSALVLLFVSTFISFLVYNGAGNGEANDHPAKEVFMEIAAVNNEKPVAEKALEMDQPEVSENAQPVSDLQLALRGERITQKPQDTEAAVGYTPLVVQQEKIAASAIDNTSASDGKNTLGIQVSTQNNIASAGFIASINNDDNKRADRAQPVPKPAIRNKKKRSEGNMGHSTPASPVSTVSSSGTHTGDRPEAPAGKADNNEVQIPAASGAGHAADTSISKATASVAGEEKSSGEALTSFWQGMAGYIRKELSLAKAGLGEKIKDSARLMPEEPQDSAAPSRPKQLPSVLSENYVGIMGGVSLAKGFENNLPNAGSARFALNPLIGITVNRTLGRRISVLASPYLGFRSGHALARQSKRENYFLDKEGKRRTVTVQNIASLEMPVSFNFYLNKRHSVGAGGFAGLVLNTWSSVKDETFSGNYTNPVSSASAVSGYREGIAPLVYGLNLQYSYNAGRVNVGLRYLHGLNDVTDNTYFMADRNDSYRDIQLLLVYKLM